jgi:hypothetical protein
MATKPAPLSGPDRASTAWLDSTAWLSRSFTASMGGLIDDVVGIDRAMATAAARRAVLVDQLRGWSEATASVMPPDTSAVRPWPAEAVARRVLVSELAAALRLPERTTENLIEESRSLAHDLPSTMSALTGGHITYRHAQVVIEHAASLPPDARGPFEESALPFAATLTVAKFDRTARVLRERAHPESIAVRHAACAEGREVSLQPGRDGMSWLSAYLPAASAHAIYGRITDIAFTLKSAEEMRTIAQLRADTFRDLLIDGVTDTSRSGLGQSGLGQSGLGQSGLGQSGLGQSGLGQSGLGRGIRARVLITVPALTLLGHGSEPASLEGYGPIDLDTARRLAADAPGFVRILTHPETGAVLSLGRTRYAIPPDLRAWLRLRDGTCRSPGCNTAARRCDLDHTRDWQDLGESNADNLAHLCRKHHNQKHHTGWAVSQAGDGDLEWSSPSGHRYVTEPATRVRPGP